MTFLFLFAAFGLCFGLQNKATFLRGSKFMDSMLNCSYCTGFHCGWVVFLLSTTLSAHTYQLRDLPQALIWAFASSAFCYAINVVLELAEGTVNAIEASKES